VIRSVAISVLVFASLGTSAARVAGLIARTYYLSADLENHSLVLRINVGWAEIAYFDQNASEQTGFSAPGRRPPTATGIFPPATGHPRLWSFREVVLLLETKALHDAAAHRGDRLSVVGTAASLRHLSRDRADPQSVLAAPLPPETSLHCGYDLTGNVSNVCPECGTQVEHRATSME
jgi:hypothetical protein